MTACVAPRSRLHSPGAVGRSAARVASGRRRVSRPVRGAPLEPLTPQPVALPDRVVDVLDGESGPPSSPPKRPTRRTPSSSRRKRCERPTLHTRRAQVRRSRCPSSGETDETAAEQRRTRRDQGPVSLGGADLAARHPRRRRRRARSRTSTVGRAAGRSPGRRPSCAAETVRSASWRSTMRVSAESSAPRSNEPRRRKRNGML